MSSDKFHMVNLLYTTEFLVVSLCADSQCPLHFVENSLTFMFYNYLDMYFKTSDAETCEKNR